MNVLELYKEEIDSASFNIERKELLIDFFKQISKATIDDIHYLSFQDIANFVNKSSYENEIFELINILESPKIAFLTRKHLFVDTNGFEEEVSQEELDEIVAINVMIHPETGVEVENWRKHIFPFFTISEKIKEQVR